MPSSGSKAADNALGRFGFRSALAAVCLFPLSFLGGCTVGPDYSLVTPERIGHSFKANSAGNQITEPLDARVPVEQWWHSFADPTLDGLVARAMAQSFDVQAAFERIVEARANYQLQTGQLAPDGNAITDYQYLKRSQNARPFVGQNGVPFNLFSKGLAVSWELDLFGRIERRIQAAEATVELQEHDLENVRQVLVADIASSYLRVRLLQEQVALTQKSIGLQQQTVDLIENRAAAGASTELDRSQTESFLHRSEALLAVLEQQLNVEFNQLSQLLGEAPGGSVVDFVGVGPLPNIPPVPATGVPADLLRRRPDVQQDERAVAAASALIGVAEADLYPRLTLLGDISLAAKSPSQLFQTDSLVFSIGPALTWNVLHFGRICNNIEVFESQFRQSMIAYQQTVLQAVREVEDGLTQHHGAIQQWDSFTRAIDADERAVELSMERYKIGKINFQRVLDTQQQLLLDQQQQATAQAAAIEQLIRTYKAVGGGWQSAPLTSDFANAGCSTCAATPDDITAETVVAANPPVAGHDLRRHDDSQILEATLQRYSNAHQLYPLVRPNAGTETMVR